MPPEDAAQMRALAGRSQTGRVSPRLLPNRAQRAEGRGQRAPRVPATVAVASLTWDGGSGGKRGALQPERPPQTRRALALGRLSLLIARPFVCGRGGGRSAPSPLSAGQESGRGLAGAHRPASRRWPELQSCLGSRGLSA